IILSIHTPPRLDGSAPMPVLLAQGCALSLFAKDRASPAIRSERFRSFARRRSHRTSGDRFPVSRQNRFPERWDRHSCLSAFYVVVRAQQNRQECLSYFSRCCPARATSL